MPLGSMAYITVTGTYLDTDGNPASGHVYFESRQALVNSSSGEVVAPLTKVAELDANGAISVSLAATDDPDYDPQDWVWYVTEKTTGTNRPTFTLSVPHDGDPIDLADVAPPGPPPSPSVDFTRLETFNDHDARHGPGGADEITGFARGDGGLQVGGLAKIKSLNPLTLEHLPSDTYEKALNLVHDVTHPDYGATGDGTTDDLAAIKSAVDTVENNGGGIVFFPMPSAYYRITDTLVADEPVGVMLIGASREGCEIVPEGTNFAGSPVIQFLNAYHSGLQWLTVRGNSTDVPSALVEVRSVTATKGHAPTGFKAQHCMLGSTSTGSATYGIQWTFDAGVDQNNDFGYVEDCQIANLDTAYRVEGVNSLEHNIVGGKVGANVATLVSFNGGSAQFFGTVFVPGLSGWVCDIEGNDYKHPIVFSGVQKESGDGILRAASTVDSNSGVNVRFTDCDLGDAQTDDTTVDFQAPNSVVSWVGTEAIAGVSGITHSYTASNTRASYVACRLDASEIAWEGVLNLVGNHHNVGSVTLTQGTDAVLTHLDESGGGPDGLTVANKDYRRDDRPLVVGAGSLEPHEGTPSVVALDVGRYNGWSLPESSTLQRLGGFLDIPDSWSTFDIDLWHTTSTGNSGDAGMFVNLLQPAAGEDLGNVDHDSGVVGITAVATADTLGVTTISSGVTAVGGATLFGMARNGSNAADTLTGAFIVIAVVLRKVS